MNDTVYDAVPYPGHPHAETHPNRIGAIARLFGVDAPPVATARILEVACGDGGNLIPMACSLPRAELVGFDLAPTAIGRAKARVEKLGLGNVRLEVADLTALDTPLGEFDYIVAHGLYSWVPEAVREALFSCLRDTLALNGVAFVSYNVYPGWYAPRMVREMLRYHTRGLVEPQARIAQARALLDFLSVACDPSDAYGRAVTEECARMAKHAPPHFFHDDLAEVNAPVHFHKFVDHARRFSLDFLAEADFATMAGSELAESARAKLDELRGDPVAHGQYLDFVAGRRFRETLLRRAEAPAAPSPVAGALRSLLLASPAVADGPVDLAPGVEVQFRSAGRASLKTDHPLAKAALDALGESWPGAMTFEALLGGACARLGRAPRAVDGDALEHVLVGAFGLRMVELLVEPFACTAKPSEHPHASALARLEAEEGDTVTGFHHRRARIDEPCSLALLRLLDGTHDRAGLGAALGRVGHTLAPEALEARLSGFARLGLLEA